MFLKVNAMHRHDDDVTAGVTANASTFAPVVVSTLRFRGSKFTAYQELALPHFPSGQQAIAVRRVRFRGTALMLWITGLTCCTQSLMHAFNRRCVCNANSSKQKVTCGTFSQPPRKNW
jgi:hypothetical protein